MRKRKREYKGERNRRREVRVAERRKEWRTISAEGMRDGHGWTHRPGNYRGWVAHV